MHLEAYSILVTVLLLTMKLVLVESWTCTSNGSFSIANSAFSSNVADFSGVVHALGVSYNITDSTFIYNTASMDCGVLNAQEGSFLIANTTFTNNTAGSACGVMFASRGSVGITGSTFTDNAAKSVGGVMITSEVSFAIANSTFSGNSAEIGGIVGSANSHFSFANCNFKNTMTSYVGAIYVFATSVYFSGHTAFEDNHGSLYSFSSNITFGGATRFENCTQASKNITSSQEGGAVTSIPSNVKFLGTNSMANNQGAYGGALLAIESTVSLPGNATIENNTAVEGGGISLRQTIFELKEALLDCHISRNTATRGGGVHAMGSTIIVNQPGTLHLVNNGADDGGGIYLAGNAKVNLVNGNGEYSRLVVTGNRATFGGGVYVDDTNSGVCTTAMECFLQSLPHSPFEPFSNIINVHFSDNTATMGGSSIYGGLLNRCIPSLILLSTHENGVNYLRNISNVMLDSIASLPVQVCFCDEQRKPDCNYQPSAIQVRKGERFTVSLVAIDQVEHPVEADIVSFLSSINGGFDEGQQTQKARQTCTDLTFNVVSSDSHEILGLFAEGPCGNSKPSVRRLNITFTDCTCPIGFQPLSDRPNRCECVCDPVLSPYITICNESTSSLQRVGTNSWITYINDTDSTGYVVHPNCPYDYCLPQTENISVNLNLPSGADAQCAYSRTGVLCGACPQNLSLSLGSSRCLRCRGHWPAVLVTVILAAIVSGILLVVAVLALNFTVAGGPINSFIFYANIIAASNSAFFSSSEPSFPTVFVAWLNLDIGFDVCFIDGLDAYAKTWLQLAYPVYIISLVILVIIVSEYSPRFARLIGKRDPIATLATLVLLSYTKLLSMTISVLSFATLEYPNGSKVNVWLPDGNVGYYQGKHTVFVIVVFPIILVGSLYTILLLFWQWLVQAPRWKMFWWTRNTKLNAFIMTYHAPYNSKYRYWTGLLLLGRVVLYIIAAFTVSSNPQIPLLMTIILVGGLFLLKEIIGMRLYRKLPMDIVETVMYFNLLAFAAFSLFDFKSVNRKVKQTAIAYISTAIAFILLIGVVIYHVVLLFKNKETSEKENTHVPKPIDARVTSTSLQIPYHSDTIPRSSTQDSFL